MFYKLSFFKKGDTVCGDDFNLPNDIEIINLAHVSSISPLQTFNLSISEKNVGIFSTVRMVGKDTYYIDGKSYEHLTNTIEGSLMCQ